MAAFAYLANRDAFESISSATSAQKEKFHQATWRDHGIKRPKLHIRGSGLAVCATGAVPALSLLDGLLCLFFAWLFSPHMLGHLFGCSRSFERRRAGSRYAGECGISERRDDDGSNPLIDGLAPLMMLGVDGATFDMPRRQIIC